MHTPLLALALAAFTQPELPYQARFTALEANKDFVEATTLGPSRQNRQIRGLWITDLANKDVAPADRPTLIIIAGIDGRHRVGVDTALGVAEKLIADHKDLLKSVRFGIVPCVNPDNYAWHLDKAHPKTDFGRAFATSDADHDGRTMEDPAEDLNGDGVISMMRIKNPKPGSDLRAEYCIDPDNPKLLKKPDATKGQKAEYALLVEGIDNDGDGKFNEDGIGGAGGGTDLNMNFPYRWQEFADGAGPYQLSEPESLAVAQWLINQNNVVAVLAFGPGDTILNQPAAGRFDPSGSLTMGIENGDKAAYDEVAKLFKEATKMTGAPGMELAGSLVGWAYSNEGMLAFSTPVWVRPDLVTKEAPAKKESGEGEKKEGAAGGGAGGAAEAPGMSQDEMRSRIQAFMTATPAEREKMMQEFNNLPADVQARIRAMAGLAPGQSPMAAMQAADRAGVQPEIPPAGTQPAAGPPAGAQPAGGGQPAGAGGGRGGRQPGGPPGGGRRGGGGGGRGPGGGAQPTVEESKAEVDTDDPKWIKYDAEQVKAGAASGFVEWKAFNHPQFGEVEIGGFVPGFKLNPPDAELPRLAEEQAKFVTSLAVKFPKLAAQEPVVEKLGPGLYRIVVRAVNEGAMASMPEVNTKARHGLPSMLTLDVPVSKLVAGEKIVRSWVITGTGGQMQAEWIVSGDDGSSVDVVFRPSVGAKRTIKVELKEAAK